MPSITFVNMDGESKTMDLTTMSNKEALFEGFDHLDKSFKDLDLLCDEQYLMI